jgi:gliding motility-associated protein GldC
LSQIQIFMKQKPEVVKTSTISLKVGLGKDNMPLHIEWEADAMAGESKPVDCKAMLLALYDRKTLETLKIDLWTTDMQVNEMDKFMFQTLRALADTYFKATQNTPLANDMQRFVQYFGEKTSILKKE